VNCRTPRALLFLVVLLTGCSIGTINTVILAKQAGEGTSVAYPLARAQIWLAIEAALNWSSAGYTEDRRTEGRLLAWFEGSNGNPTTFAGVWVEAGKNAETLVTVITRRQMWVGGTALTEGQFHRDLAAAVSLLQMGKPLPLVRPD
jgi:hypothetical protein